MTAAVSEGELEVDYEKVKWPAEKFLGRFVHCSDVMPRDTRISIEEELGREVSSYSQAAQALLRQRRSVVQSS